MKLFHILTFEWYISIKHSIQNHTSAPHIDCPSIISLFGYDLRGNVSWCTTLIIENLARFDLFAYSEVGNFYMTLIVKKDVFQLDISMQNVLRMNIANTLYDLLEEVFSKSLIELPPLPDKGEQVTSSTQFHDKEVVFLCLKSLKKLYH